MSTEIAIFEYIKGEQFTEKLKEVNKLSSLGELANVYKVPKTTFSTWNTHNRNSHELVVRTHLRTGIPVKDLILPDDFPVTELHSSFWGTTEATDYKTAETPVRAVEEAAILKYAAQKPAGNPQHQTLVVDSFCLTSGQLIKTGEIPYPARRINSFGLEHSKVIEVETNEAIYLIDQSNTDAISGRYLIDIDGRLSINAIQRLPGKKLTIAFGDSSFEVLEHDIVVIGRVAVTLKKD